MAGATKIRTMAVNSDDLIKFFTKMSTHKNNHPLYSSVYSQLSDLQLINGAEPQCANTPLTASCDSILVALVG